MSEISGYRKGIFVTKVFSDVSNLSDNGTEELEEESEELETETLQYSSATFQELLSTFSRAVFSLGAFAADLQSQAGWFLGNAHASIAIRGPGSHDFRASTVLHWLVAFRETYRTAYNYAMEDHPTREGEFIKGPAYSDIVSSSDDLISISLARAGLSITQLNAYEKEKRAYDYARFLSDIDVNEEIQEDLKFDQLRDYRSYAGFEDDSEGNNE